MVDLPWKTVCAILKKDLEARKKRIDLRHLKYLAIDEVSVGKGQNNYLTVVLDLTTGRAVHVVEGRTKRGLARFFSRLRRMRVRLTAVAMDMHAPFRDAVVEYYGTRVVIVYDHFHVSKLLNEQLDEVRREQMRLAESAQGKRVLKGIRFLLLRASENLKEDGEERLNAVFAINSTLRAPDIRRLAWATLGRHERRSAR
jgi:transposase